jgi:hypothetical protein
MQARTRALLLRHGTLCRPPLHACCGAVNGTEVRDHRQCVEFIERRCRVGDCEVGIRSRSIAVDAVRRLYSPTLLSSLSFHRGVGRGSNIRLSARRATLPSVRGATEGAEGAATGAGLGARVAAPVGVRAALPMLRAGSPIRDSLPHSPMVAEETDSPRGSPRPHMPESRQHTPIVPRAGA